MGHDPVVVTTRNPHAAHAVLFVKMEGGWKFSQRTLLIDQGEMGK